MKAFAKLLLALTAVLGLVACQPAEEAKASGDLKVGYIYVGPVGDLGWSNAHDVGRRYVESKIPGVSSVIVEAVPETDAARVIDRLVNEEKCNFIFTTSFGYMDDTVKAAEKYPNVTFMHCSGFKQGPNLGTYFAELYEMYYLNGLIAGALTKTDKVGYVGAFPISEVIRHIDAYALGVKAVNPDAKVYVRWINSWYDPAKAREAALALAAEGVDALAFTEDSPAVIEVAAEKTKAGTPTIAFGHYSPMQSFGEDVVASGQLVDWGVMYEKILGDYKAGKWTNTDLWWKAAEGAAKLGGSFEEPVNKKFVEPLKAVMVDTPDLGKVNVYDLVMARYDAVKAGTFEPFTGPIKAQDGTEKIPAGAKATKEELLGITYFVDNVVGTIPTN